MTWMPNVTNGNPGMDFIVKYRIKNQDEWMNTHLVVDELFVDIFEISSNETYEIVVASVEDEFTTESKIREINRGENSM